MAPRVESMAVEVKHFMHPVKQYFNANNLTDKDKNIGSISDGSEKKTRQFFLHGKSLRYRG